MNCPNGPEVATGELIQTAMDCSGPNVHPNGVGDTEIRSIGLQLLLRNSARIENGPTGARTPESGADHAPPLHRTEKRGALILPSTLAGLTDSERRTLLIHLLDQARDAYIAARAERVELMMLARDNGVSCRDIGIVLGISEQSARAQINRAKARDL